jgi:hypothetical protein
MFTEACPEIGADAFYASTETRNVLKVFIELNTPSV